MEIQPGQDLMELFRLRRHARPTMKDYALEEAERIGALMADPETATESVRLLGRLLQLRALYGRDVEKAFEVGRTEGFHSV